MNMTILLKRVIGIDRVQKEFINKIVLFNKNSKTVLSDLNLDTTELLPPEILFKLEIGS